MEYRCPDVVVVGTGRSGTSAVARVLHERIGVCMGHFIKTPNAANPKGFHEDWLEHGLMQNVLQDVTGIDEFMRHVGGSHRSCERWGFKDPWFLYLPLNAMKAIDPKLVIRTWRPLEYTVKSWMRKELLFGRMMTDEDAEKFKKICIDRERLMDEKLGMFDVLEIRFDRFIGEDDLAREIGRRL